MQIKFYVIKILAAFSVMGSFGAGFVVGASYGLWLGLLSFISLFIIGIVLHKVANRVRGKTV